LKTIAANRFKANALAPNWGQTIFQSANEMAANTVFKKRLDEIQAKAPADKEWWEKRRASIQAELLGEENVVPAKSISSKAGSDSDAVLVDTPTAGGDNGSIRKKKGKK
jgi:translocation protein SEC66